jgi:bacterioferritin-associated ferredoxin
MIVCVCHRISDRDIERAAHQGCASLDDLQDELPVGRSCGACLECAHDTFAAACRAHGRTVPQAIETLSG